MTEQQQRVSELVGRIEKHQKDLGLKDSPFVLRYQRHIGSSKTWRERLCGRDWKELGLRLDKWEKKLSAFVQEIDGNAAIAEYFEDLPIAQYANATFHKLQGASSDRRCVWIIGNTGTGKTCSLRYIATNHPRKAVYVSANETWKESRMQIAGGLARAVGCAEGRSAAQTIRNVVENQMHNPLTICVDEMHEGGVLLMKLVKSIINETPARFILGIYPTAWTRLVNGTTDATAEAQQLLGRSVKPIVETWARGLTLRDIEQYLKCSTDLGDKCRLLADSISADIRMGGNLRLLADAVELAKANADEDGIDLDPGMVTEAVQNLMPKGRK